LAPDLEVLAPARNWGMSREASVDYAIKWEVPVRATKEKIYSIDENLWGRAIECGAMEDPWAQPPEEPMTLTRVRSDEPVELIISFDAGLPVAIDGTALSLADLIKTLNDRAGSTGFGRLDMVENRRVGIKSREVYECPAALAIIAAHSDLEDLVLERDVHHEKARLEIRWAELVYDGMWFSPLKEALDSFMLETQRHVTGDVRMRFEAPGFMRIVGRRSPHALYDYGLATYDAGDSFQHADSEGFVKIYGLGIKTWAARQGAKNSTPPHS
jgi:argininosuccinate synthase